MKRAVTAMEPLDSDQWDQWKEYININNIFYVHWWEAVNLSLLYQWNHWFWGLEPCEFNQWAIKWPPIWWNTAQVHAWVQCPMGELVPIHNVNAYEPSGSASTVSTWIQRCPLPHPLALKLCLRKAICLTGARWSWLRCAFELLETRVATCSLVMNAFGALVQSWENYQRGLVARDSCRIHMNSLRAF